ncbi:efflux transporter outer membrane subunit [Methyloparacoccus murrellii]
MPAAEPGRRAALLLGMALLGGCGGGLITTVGPDYGEPAVPAAPRWQAPQPDVPRAHGGDPASLKRWWDRFDDRVLARFLAAAQRESASVAEARSRIDEARAGMVGAIAAGLPNLNSQTDFVRQEGSFGGPVFEWTRYQTGLQSSWEIDLFGGIARQREAALSQLDARTDAWHDARVAVAVEVANAYLGYRHCQALVNIAAADAASRRASARLVEVAGQVGLRAPADVALSQASAADGQELLARQHGVCERAVKSLVALTGLGEAEVRHRLTAQPGQLARLPEPPPFRLGGIPARALMQRPDVAAAERQVAEASASIGVEEAKRYPRLSLSGNVTPTLQSINGAALYLAHTWQIGPTLTLPIFDAGKRAADVEAARARYEASASKFRATVRTAVKEVEDALVRLHNAEERLPEARAAVRGYRDNFRATDQLYRIGLGNLIDVEASRRQALNAERTVADLEQERVSAWIALYRAAGGGWEDSDNHALAGAPGAGEAARPAAGTTENPS